jgi:glyoxylase-like metal-dependent hydrolase (beta-lactamase superfamily II)
MRISLAILMRLAAGLLLAVLSAAAQDQATALRSSNEKARRVLEAAIEAHGGQAAMDAVENISFNREGRLTPRQQMESAQPPYRAGRQRDRLVLDVKGNRLVGDTEGNVAGFDFKNRTIVSGGEGYNVDFVAHTFTKLPQTTLSGPPVGQFYRRLPHEILRNAQQRNLTLRWLGEGTFEGRKQNVITYAHTDNSALALYFDAQTNLLSKYELLFPDPLTGDTSAEIVFSDYQTAGGLKVPGKWTQLVAGEVNTEFRYSDFVLNVKLDDALFRKPEGFEETPPFPAGRPIKTAKLAEDVYEIQDVGGGGYSVLAVGFNDYILAVEAPLNTGATQAAIAKIKELIPNKPIRYVVLTHHHGDHSGGLRAFIAEGATVVTTPGNRKLFEAMAAAKLRDALGKNPRPAVIETIAGRKRVFRDDRHVVELYDIGPSPHTDEMVIVYLPKEKILFQGDLFSPADTGPLPAALRPTVHLAEKIRELGLQVETVVGVHGRPARYAELQETLERRKAGD